jgi:hypothetical protein
MAASRMQDKAIGRCVAGKNGNCVGGSMIYAAVSGVTC